MIQTLLLAATYAIVRKDFPSAINYVSEARALARQSDTQRNRAVAAYCTMAMQKLLPLAVQDELAYAGWCDHVG